jgi:small-conductance mechanosensitive channel
MKTTGTSNKQELKQLIMDIIRQEKPQTTQQLVTLITVKTGLSANKISTVLLELEKEDLVHFTKPQIPTPKTFKAYLFSKNSAWFWICTGFSVVTILALLIPENVYPAAYLRISLSVVFALFLPGFSLTKTLFPATVPLKISEDTDSDKIERVVVSLGLSLALIPVIALLLNYTPWGIRLAPLAASLFMFTLAFSLGGIIREFQVKNPKPASQPNRLID